MPRFLVPHKHGPHRYAASALYRALLGAIPGAAVPTNTKNNLRTLIRSRFRRNRRLQSHTLLRELFTHSYEVLDRLDLTRPAVREQNNNSAHARHTANANVEEDERNEAVTWLNDYVQQPRNVSLLAKIADYGRIDVWVVEKEAREEALRLRANPRNESAAFRGPEFGIMNRPRPLSDFGKTHEGMDKRGSTPASNAQAEVEDQEADSVEPQQKKRRKPIRHIPKIYSASRIPVLRIKKPQPRNLSLYLNSRINQRQARVNRIYEYVQMRDVAAGEDTWDRLLKERFGREVAEEPVLREGRGRHTWARPWQDAVMLVKDLLDRDTDGASRRVGELVRIVEEEKRLKELERKDRKMERNKLAWARKIERWKREGVYDEQKVASSRPSTPQSLYSLLGGGKGSKRSGGVEDD